MLPKHFFRQKHWFSIGFSMFPNSDSELKGSNGGSKDRTQNPPQGRSHGSRAAPARLKIDDPYRRSAIWPSNSLDKTATPFLILDRGVEFWGPKSWIFKCMQRNRHFSKKINVCITQNQYFSIKIHGFSSWHPYRGSAISPSNSRIRDVTLEFSRRNGHSISHPR